MRAIMTNRAPLPELPMNLARFVNRPPSDRLKLAKLFARAAVLSRPGPKRTPTKDEKGPNK
jgi:hypothetical protein